LADYQKLIDAVSADLAGYDQRIHDIGPCGYSDAEILPEKRCAWQKTATYGLQDLVKHKDQYYLSIAAPTVGTPPDQELTSWLAVSLPDVIFAGAFSQERQQAPSPYVPGNFVLFNERYWLCAKNCNQNPPINPNWIAATAGAHKPIDPVVIASRRDNSTIYQNMVTRTITYSLDSLNLVSYSQQTAPAATNKKAIAAIAISFADRPNQRAGIPTGVPPTAFRWEASAGVFFSWLPNRSFTLSSTGAVIDSKTRPTPVPFAAANYRLTGDFGKRWKQNLYLTGAIGVNANNTTGEFGAGGSYAWRGLMVSLLGHFGHDLRPTSYTPGGSGTLPTVSHWTVNPAIGISVRVPSLTGR